MQLPMSNVGFTELKKLTHKHPTTLIVLYGTEPDRQAGFGRNKLLPFPTSKRGEGWDLTPEGGHSPFADFQVKI